MTVRRIVVMRSEQIIEEGNHDALIARCGHYAELYNMYLRHQLFATVGYGIVRNDKTGGPHSFVDNNERRYVMQSFLALRPAWIQLSMNPSTGNGGTCHGDSGGPHFIGDTNVIAAITVTGDRYCRATDVDYRMDTESARSYLSQFVVLP